MTVIYQQTRRSNLPALLPVKDLITVNNSSKGELHQTSIPSDSRRWAEGIEPMLKKKMFSDGGFTLSPYNAKPVKSGISVCSDPAAILCLSSDNWDSAQVLAWLAENKERLEQHKLNLGGWLDSAHGVMFLELVWVFPEHLKDACLLVAAANGRQSVYHLGKRELIYLNTATD